MSERAILITMLLLSLVIAILSAARGLDGYAERDASARQCERAGGGDRECWRMARGDTQGDRR